MTIDSVTSHHPVYTTTKYGRTDRVLADLLHDGVDESTRLRKLVDAAVHLLDGRVVLVDVERVALDLLDVRL